MSNSNIKDGHIKTTTTGQDWIETKIACAAVEGGELTVYLSVHPNGWVHMHFSGLGDKAIIASQTNDNTVELQVYK